MCKNTDVLEVLKVLNLKGPLWVVVFRFKKFVEIEIL